MRSFTFTSTRVAALRAIPFFADLDDDEIAVVDRLSTEITLDAGRRLIREGDPGRQAFILLDGRAAVTVDGERIATLGPGDIAGEMALLDGGARGATVTTETKVRVLVFDPRSFATMLHDPAVTKRILTTISGRLRTAEAPPRCDAEVHDSVHVR